MRTQSVIRHIQVPNALAIFGFATLAISFFIKQPIFSFICTFIPVAAILTANALFNAAVPYFAKGDRAIAIAYVNGYYLSCG